MKVLFSTLTLLLIFAAGSYAELHATYFQSKTQVTRVIDGETLVCSDNHMYQQGNDQIKDVKQYIGQIVYIKYFNRLNKDYYVAINFLEDGEFNLPDVQSPIFQTESEAPR